MVSLEYANAYSEVLEILRYISKEDYDKIPKDKIELFTANANKDFNFTYDVSKTLDEQNVSKKAKTIIAILFRDYWATDVQREKIKAKEQYDRKIEEERNREKYNPNNLFKKNEDTKNVEIIAENNQIIPYKESIFRKIFNKIRRSLIKLKKN